MSIHDYLNEVKSTLQTYGKDILIALSICAACTLGYGIGLLNHDTSQGAAVISSFKVATDAKAESQPSSINVGANKAVEAEGMGVVYASKNGTRYYFSNCGGLSRIKPENKISFPNPAAAEATGLTLASGCRP
jgi:hypothetical protein